ncbi:MAG TPA: ABC transporter permease [Phycisphaerae bacterium]|nr:ABC transporter permease [Phycisphaerae bacterium]HOJ72688.1 ABC transporter permease [Phycisphaerae bacterium]HOM49651.1 ABC transporter permease [Phycisphaerae bacterium]HON65084.1 ABC transporter permease [Phycisphaerae bacterium]HOQ84091.1 ABC transporter permease [Phycisphaerae bacterium]
MGEFWQYRDLLYQLVRREVVVRYRHSVLGVAWALLQPLGMMLLFTFVFTRAVSLGAIRELGVPYPLWAYLGILPWTLFAMGLTGAVQSLASHRDLVTKVYFPQQILPLSAIASAFFDFCVAGAVLVGLVVYYQVTTAWQMTLGPALLLLPGVVLVQLLLMAGLGLWLALANLWFRDVKYLFGVGIQMWMFLTNVLYPLPNDGSALMRFLTTANPMVPIISAYRRIVIEGGLPEPVPFAVASFAAMGLAATGWAAYQRLEGRFAERV